MAARALAPQRGRPSRGPRCAGWCRVGGMVAALLCQVWEAGEGAPAGLPRRVDAQDENAKLALPFSCLCLPLRQTLQNFSF